MFVPKEITILFLVLLRFHSTSTSSVARNEMQRRQYKSDVVLTKDKEAYYDKKQEGAVARLVCNYVEFCSNSCSKCRPQWSAFHQGKRVNVSLSNAHTVATNASACLSLLSVLWTTYSKLPSYYICIVTDDAGEQAISKSLRLRLRITLKASVAAVASMSGDTLNLQCPSQEPLPKQNLSEIKCHWRKDGKPIPTNSQKFHHTNHPWLTLRNLTQLDSGVYDCLLQGKGLTKSAKNFSHIYLSILEEKQRSFSSNSSLKSNNCTLLNLNLNCFNNSVIDDSILLVEGPSQFTSEKPAENKTNSSEGWSFVYKNFANVNNSDKNNVKIEETTETSFSVVMVAVVSTFIVFVLIMVWLSKTKDVSNESESDAVEKSTNERVNTEAAENVFQAELLSDSIKSDEVRAKLHSMDCRQTEMQETLGDLVIKKCEPTVIVQLHGVVSSSSQS